MISVEQIGDELPAEVVQILARGEYVGNPDKIQRSWAQSSVSESPKWTEGAFSCVCAVVSGETTSGDLISLLVHLNKGAVNRREGLFEVEYPSSLQKLERQTVKETRAAFILGGYIDSRALRRTASFDYDLTVSWLKEYHRTYLGIASEVLPPKNFIGLTNVFVGKSGKIYIQELDENSPFGIALKVSKLSYPRIWK